MSTTTVRGAIRGMGHRANPAFAVGAVAVPAAALTYALTVGPIVHHIYSSVWNCSHLIARFRAIRCR